MGRLKFAVTIGVTVFIGCALWNKYGYNLSESSVRSEGKRLLREKRLEKEASAETYGRFQNTNKTS